jgi:hypothetical protein
VSETVKDYLDTFDSARMRFSIDSGLKIGPLPVVELVSSFALEVQIRNTRSFRVAAVIIFFSAHSHG